MKKNNILVGELLDKTALTLEEFALACAVEPEWVLERVKAGFLSSAQMEESTWCFISADLVRARRLISIERDFDANSELAALVTDLIEEINRLKQHLRAAGLPEN